MNEFYCETQLSEKISKTPEGFLICHDVPITVAGDMHYLPQQVGDFVKAKNGYITANKKIEDIHSEETIKSFEGKPITVGHPKDPSGKGMFVTPENAKELTHGILQNVRPGRGAMNDKLLADFVIMDKDAIESVESGELRQVSSAYNYDAANIQDGYFEQTNIRGNHVALVKNGRAGPQCAIFDSKEETKKMSLKEKLKEAISVFTRAVDEAVPEETQEEKKKASDESPMEQAVENMAFMSLDSRVGALEEMIAEIASKLKEIVFNSAADSAEEEIKEGQKEEVKEDPKEEKESYDSETISKAEILAPGIEKESKNLKKRALDSFISTSEGNEIIKSLNGGKSFDESDLNVLFNASASIISMRRSNSLKATAHDSRTEVTFKNGGVKELNRKYKEMWNKQMGDK